MKNPILIFFFLMVMFTNGCSKDEDASGTAMLDKDPSVDESFGLRINLGSYGLPRFYGNAWGSSSQLFISAERGIVKADFVDNTLTSIAPNSGAIVSGLSGDKSMMIFVGDYNGSNGYYGYSIATPNSITPLVSLNKDEATTVSLYDNHLLLGTGVWVTTGRPCTGIGDFWCGTSQVVENYTLYHVDAVTKASKLIGPSHYPILFSDDGQMVLISGNSKLYEYDLNLLQKTDSIPYTGGRSIFWGNTGLQTLEVDINREVIIADLKTNNEITRFQPSGFLIGVLMGPTGRKVYYTGACPSSDCTYAIWSFNLDTRQEVRHVWTTDTTPLTSPFEEIQVAPDDQSLVFRHVNSLYLKKL